MAWDYFPDGKKIGGFKVMEVVVRGERRRTTRYNVTCLQCERTTRITHEVLENRALNGVTGCKVCNQIESRMTKDKPVVEEQPMQGVVDGRGYFWPFLGEMRTRAGAKRGVYEPTEPWYGQDRRA